MRFLKTQGRFTKLAYSIRAKREKIVVSGFPYWTFANKEQLTKHLDFGFYLQDVLWSEVKLCI